MELRQDELDNILAGTSQEMAEDNALKNPSSYRERQIEELKKEKEILENLEKKLDDGEVKKR